jgi:MFS family permease
MCDAEVVALREGAKIPLVSDDGSQILPAPLRRRAYSSLFAGVATSTTGFIAVATVNSLVAEDLTGTAAWSGIPAAMTVLGTAVGATTIVHVVHRVGPWLAMALGYLVGACAITAAAYAIVSQQFLWFVVALFVFGAGHGSNRLARYVAADLYPISERATMIGWIVWASTIGAVAGPSLLAPARAFAEWMAVSGLVGPYLLCAVAALVSGAITLAGRVHQAGAQVPGASDSMPAPIASPVAHDRWTPDVMLSLVSMVSGQFVMVLVMTMTPVHLRHGGHGLGAIGAVIAAHTLGMFGLSPITGKLADRFGRRRVLAAAVVLLLVACGTALVAAWTSSYIVTLAALFLLGVGWNAGFVAGSALLTDSVPLDARARMQGLGDTWIWGGGACASIASGWLLARVGFAGLSAIGAALALVPVWWLISRRRTFVPDGPPGQGLSATPDQPPRRGPGPSTHRPG